MPLEPFLGDLLILFNCHPGDEAEVRPEAAGEHPREAADGQVRARGEGEDDGGEGEGGQQEGRRGRAAGRRRQAGTPFN